VKLVHLAGFIIRMYHNARSSECLNDKFWSVPTPPYFFGLLNNLKIKTTYIVFKNPISASQREKYVFIVN